MTCLQCGTSISSSKQCWVCGLWIDLEEHHWNEVIHNVQMRYRQVKTSTVWYSVPIGCLAVFGEEEIK